MASHGSSVLLLASASFVSCPLIKTVMILTTRRLQAGSGRAVSRTAKALSEVKEDSEKLHLIASQD
jgi:hypothetical protein